MPHDDKRDKILSTSSTTGSLGTTSSAGLTEGLMGTSPLLSNYDDDSEFNVPDENLIKEEK